MLVVSRTEGEAVAIGSEIEVLIVRVRGRRITLGISAPRTIPVHRKEIREAVERARVGTKVLPRMHGGACSHARSARAGLPATPAVRTG